MREAHGTAERRKAERDALLARMNPPRRFRVDGGRLVEVELP
ncbi:hypothetical protein AB0F18_14455 [Streptomyces sp. NPDC029216]